MTVSASLPLHQYVLVESAAIRRNGEGFEPAVWFGLHSHPGRVWGCHLMLECGAVYRNVPPHRIAFSEDAPEWSLQQAQLWDCYGRDFALHRYDYLSTLDGIARVRGEDVAVHYLFTAVPYGDAFSECPEQDKEFMFLRTGTGRLTIQPTNRIIFRELSFTGEPEWPRDLAPTRETFSCEAKHV